MIESPPKKPTLEQAEEWITRALRDEDFPILFGGRAAIDRQGEYTGSTDADILIGTDFRGANSVLDAYVDRGDLFPVGATTDSQVVRYLVSGFIPVDIIDAPAVHPRLFDLILNEASTEISIGSAGPVDAVTREGYFVLAILIGKLGFARNKRDPMMKVREAWDLFGQRTAVSKVNTLLRKLGVGVTLEEAIAPPG